MPEKNPNNDGLSESDQIALEQLGYDQWFADNSKPHLKDNFSVGRITEVNRNSYIACTGAQSTLAKLSGRFKFNHKNKADHPTVGDWVMIRRLKNESIATIQDVLPRKSVLKRRDPGKAVKFQLIAANIDAAFVIQSVDSNFDLNRLERYLVMVNESRIQPIVVLSKTDLISADELANLKDRILRLNDKYLFLPISNISGQGIEDMRNELKPNHTYCLLGSSGVGKTTLLNTLLGEELFQVSPVREKDSKGMHTTTKRQLIRLDSGPIFIDTPGMRELGNFAIDAGLSETFDDIASYSTQCRFNDCTHTHETNCAVITAVKEGLIDKDRYENYLTIQQEAAFHESSYVAKKRNDKAFAKIRRNYMKTAKKK